MCLASVALSAGATKKQAVGDLLLNRVVKTRYTAETSSLDKDRVCVRKTFQNQNLSHISITPKIVTINNLMQIQDGVSMVHTKSHPLIHYICPVMKIQQHFINLFLT